MDKAKKRRIKKVITWAAMALVVALLTAMPLIARSEAEADGPVASILTAQVTEGTITTSLRGGGTIRAEHLEEVKLPDGVKITEFLVKNGAYVTEGTPLASVDKVSVMTAITQVGQTLDYLREELEAARNDQVPAYITATAGGRVKKVFARKGETVQQVMLRDGALAIVSLDGMMAVKIDHATPLTTGEHITVTLSDGQNVDGRVESNLDGVAVITVEDEGYAIGQTVTVSREGEILGQGSLYIHNAWRATAYTGTIETVYAREETAVSEGAGLFALSDRDFEGELRHRADQHRQYEALLQELFQMYKSGCIYAPCDGEVEGVDENSAFLLSTENQEWTILWLSGGDGCTGDGDCPLPADSGLHAEDCIQKCDRNDQCDAQVHHPDCIKLCDSDNPSCKALNHYPGCASVCTGKPGCLALQAKHNAGCPEKCTGDASCKSSRDVKEHLDTCIVHCKKDTDGSDGDQCGTGHAHYPVCIGSCSETTSCTAINHKAECPLYGVSYTATAGVVVRCVSGQIVYKYDKTAAGLPVTRSSNGSWNLPVTPNPMTMNEQGFIASDAEYSAGSMLLIVTATKDGEALWTRAFPYSGGSGGSGGGLPGGMGGFGDLSGLSGLAGFGGLDISAMIGGFSGFGNYSGAQTQEEEPLFNLEGQTLLTVIPHDTATLTISIDEHDIAKVTTGMEATVKVEALKGAEFPAKVTAVSRMGSNNGGSSKYQVELTLKMDPQMLSGMSASARIPLEQKTVPMIPAAALVQQGAKTVVYTGLSEKGELAAPVEVTTGVTDGEYVQILSGLEPGQQVCYRYYDTVKIDNSAEADKYSLY